MDLFRGVEKFLIEAEKRGSSPRLRASRGFSGGMSGPSPGIVSSSRGLIPSAPAFLGVATGSALNIMSRGAVIPSIIETAQSVFNPSDNIVTALGDLGTAVHNQFAPPEQRKLYNPIPRNDPRNARIIREREAARETNRPEGSISTLGNKPVQWMDNRWVPFLTEGEMARQQQVPPPPLNLPPSSTFSPATTMTAAPADRTYEAEKQRVAQMAAQDPLAKKYQVADLTKAYSAAATPEEKEKIGLQIWATTNPQLAQKLKPGQVGYEEAVGAFTAQTPFAGMQKATGEMQFADKLTAGLGVIPPGVNPYTLATPLTNIGFQAPSQVGISEKFSDFTPNSMEAYSNPLKFLSGFMNMQEAARTKGLFERGLK